MVLPDSDRIPRAPPYSGTTQEAMTFQIRGFHSLWRTFPNPSSNRLFSYSLNRFKPAPSRPTTTKMQRLKPWHIFVLDSSAFARRYWRNRNCFLFLWLLRWFTSPRWLQHAMYSHEGNVSLHTLGSPIRTSPVHRLFASPRSFSQLTTSFIASYSQGIRPAPLGT